MPCTAISRDNLKVVGPCAKPTYLTNLCLFHWEMANGVLSPPGAGGNMFPNGSFEVDTSLWAGWGASVFRSTDRAKIGSASGLVTAGPTDYGVSMMNGGFPNVTPANSIAILPNTPYIWSVWIYPLNAGNYDIVFEEHDEAGANITYGQTITNCPANVWTQMTSRVISKPTGRYTWAQINNRTGAPATFYLDGGRLEVGTVPAPL